MNHALAEGISEQGMLKILADTMGVRLHGTGRVPDRRSHWIFEYLERNVHDGIVDIWENPFVMLYIVTYYIVIYYGYLNFVDDTSSANTLELLVLHSGH